jgi:hypothetical protein
MTFVLQPFVSFSFSSMSIATIFLKTKKKKKISLSGSSSLGWHSSGIHLLRFPFPHPQSLFALEQSKSFPLQRGMNPAQSHICAHAKFISDEADLDILLAECSFSICSAELRDTPREENRRTADSCSARSDGGRQNDADASEARSPRDECRTMTPSPSAVEMDHPLRRHHEPQPLPSPTAARPRAPTTSPSEPFHASEEDRTLSHPLQPDYFPNSASFSTLAGSRILAATVSATSFATSGAASTGRTIGHNGNGGTTNGMVIFGLPSFVAEGQDPIQGDTSLATTHPRRQTPQGDSNSFRLDRDDSQEEVYGGLSTQQRQLSAEARDEDEGGGGVENQEDGVWLYEEGSKELALGTELSSNSPSQASFFPRNDTGSSSFFAATTTLNHGNMTNNNSSLGGTITTTTTALPLRSIRNLNPFIGADEQFEFENDDQQHYQDEDRAHHCASQTKNFVIPTPEPKKVLTPLEALMAKLEKRYWNQNFDHQPSGQIHVSEILCAIFLYLPAHRSTLLRASEVSRAWCERIERLPQWRFVPVIRQQQLLQLRRVTKGPQQRRAPPRRTAEGDMGTNSVVGTSPLFSRRPPAWWRAALKKHRYVELEGSSPTTPPTPFPPSQALLASRPSDQGGSSQQTTATEVDSPATVVADHQPSYQPVATVINSKGLTFLTLDPSRTSYIRAMVEQWLDFDREMAEQRRQDRRDQVERCAWSVRVVLLALVFLVTIFTVGWAIASANLDLISTQGQIGGVLFFITFVLSVIVIVLGAYSWHAILKNKTEQLRTSVGTGTVTLFLALLLISFVGSVFFSIYTLKITALENILDVPVLDLGLCGSGSGIGSGTGGGGGSAAKLGSGGVEAPYLVRFPPESARYWTLNHTHPWIASDSGLSFLTLTPATDPSAHSKAGRTASSSPSSSSFSEVPNPNLEEDKKNDSAASEQLHWNSNRYALNCPSLVQVGILDFRPDSGFLSSQQAWIQIQERNVNNKEELIFRTTRFAYFYPYPPDIASRSGWSESDNPVGLLSSHVVLIGTIPQRIPNELPDSALDGLVLARIALVGICCGLFLYTVMAFFLGMALYHRSTRVLVWLMFTVLVLNILVLLGFGAACFFGDGYDFCALNKTTAQAIFIFSCIALFVVHVIAFLVACK